MINSELKFIYKYTYKKFKILNVEIYFCKNRFNTKITLTEIKKLLKIIPQKHRKFIPRIYVVDYFCENKEIKGRHLAKLNYIVIYPNALNELKKILIHEIGHVLWDKMLSPEQRIEFYFYMMKDVPITSKKNNLIERHVFVLENVMKTLFS